MTGGQKHGLTAALELCGAGLAADGGADDQLELIEADAPLPLASAPAVARAKRRRGPNKRTEEWVSYLLGRYRSPLVGLLETYSRSARELAETLELWQRDHLGHLVLDDHGKPQLSSTAMLEAFKVQMAAQAAALPYLHQRLPQAIEVKGEQRGLLVIGSLDMGAGEGSDGLVLPLAPIEENQQVIEHEAGKSDGGKSDASAKPLSGQGK